MHSISYAGRSGIGKEYASVWRQSRSRSSQAHYVPLSQTRPGFVIHNDVWTLVSCFFFMLTKHWWPFCHGKAILTSVYIFIRNAVCRSLCQSLSVGIKKVNFLLPFLLFVLDRNFGQIQKDSYNTCYIYVVNGLLSWRIVEKWMIEYAIITNWN